MNCSNLAQANIFQWNCWYGLFLFPLFVSLDILFLIVKHHYAKSSTASEKQCRQEWLGSWSLETYSAVSAYFMSNIPTNAHYGKSANISPMPGIIGFTKTLTTWSCDVILLVTKHQLNLWVCFEYFREHGWWPLSVLEKEYFNLFRIILILIFYPNIL